MQNKIISANSKTLKLLIGELPQTNNMMKMITYAMQMLKDLKIEINEELEDGEIRIKEEK